LVPLRQSTNTFGRAKCCIRFGLQLELKFGRHLVPNGEGHVSALSHKGNASLGARIRVPGTDDKVPGVDPVSGNIGERKICRDASTFFL
jgi:hypothetical protein